MESKPIKIAFGYKMGSGKDTASDYILQKYGGNKVSFAKPLYDILMYAQTVAGFPFEKDRMFLQWVGTEWGRNKNMDVWVNAAMKNLPTGNIVLSDLRYVNEFNACKKEGIICINLVRNVSDDRKGSGTKFHISETELDIIPVEDWDYIIENNGTKKQFLKKLETIIDNL
jgi:hypothetical protein